MYNEAETLQYLLRIELVLFSSDAPVLVFINKKTGKYIDHFIDGDYSRKTPNIIQQRSYDIRLFECTLGELNQAILNEYESRKATT